MHNPIDEPELVFGEVGCLPANHIERKLRRSFVVQRTHQGALLHKVASGEGPTQRNAFSRNTGLNNQLVPYPCAELLLTS